MMSSSVRLWWVPPRRARPLAGHADAEARRSVLTALLCATLVTMELSALLQDEIQCPPMVGVKIT